MEIGIGCYGKMRLKLILSGLFNQWKGIFEY